MRVIEAQHFETAMTRGPSRVDVIFRIDQETAGTGCEVSRPHGFDDGVASTEEQSATLGRRRVACVSDDVVVGPTTEDDIT